MPLKIVTRDVKNTEIRAVSLPGAMSQLMGVKMVVFTAAEFVPITMWGYGRMDRSTPAKGLVTGGVASCTAIVFHCADTGRTILSHSPNRLMMLTFVPMIDWVTGGTGELESYMQRFMWQQGKDVTSATQKRHVDVGIFRGFDYGVPSNAARFGHEGWMKDFYKLWNDIKENRPITVDITDEHILASGGILVDKVTGTVSLLKLPSPHSKSVINHVLSPEYDSLYSPQMCSRDIFIGNFIYSKDDVVDIHLQWNVKEFMSSIALPDDARLFARANKDVVDQGIEAWKSALARGGGPQKEQVLSCLKSCLQQGMPCEKCNKVGGRRCSRCEGAWYCSREHQEADWTQHKKWCKKYRLPTKNNAT